MFGLFGGKKKDKNKDIQVSIGSEIVIDQTVQQMTAQADVTFAKPKYNPQTRKSHYDDGAAHRAVKEKAFSSGDIVRDPYTGAELVSTIEEAKMRYGDNYQEHLAEADHIDPLNQIVKRNENNAWITDKDLKDIGNREENYQIISRRMNQTGGKGGSTQTEWSQDDERMSKISEQTGEPVESIAKRIRETGEIAERRTNAKVAQASIRNMATTAHDAGKKTAANSGGAAATISGIYNVVSCINGEQTISEGLENVGKDTCKAAISGYVKGAALTSFNHTLTFSKLELLATFGKNNVAEKVITTVSIVGESVGRWANDEISTEEFLIELGDKGCNFVGSSYGALIGQTLIPIPIVGGAVGSLIGGTLTSELFNTIVQEIQSNSEEERRKQEEMYQAMMRYYAEQQRREEVQQLIRINTEKAVMYSVQSIVESGEFQNLMKEASGYFEDYVETEKRIAECVLVTLQLQEYRRQLQEYIDNYFAGYEDCFASALELMDSSLKMGDYNGAIAGTNQVTKLFGKTPVVKNTEDFKKKIFGNGNISF